MRQTRWYSWIKATRSNLMMHDRSDTNTQLMSHQLPEPGIFCLLTYQQAPKVATLGAPWVFVDVFGQRTMN